MKNKKLLKKELRKKRIRSKIQGSDKKPRLSVYRSSKHIYAQVINDSKSETLVSVNDREVKDEKKRSKTEIALESGKIIAQKAIKQKIHEVVFDRNGNKYHGRVKALAEGAREGGLKF